MMKYRRNAITLLFFENKNKSAPNRKTMNWVSKIAHENGKLISSVVMGEIVHLFMKHASISKTIPIFLMAGEYFNFSDYSGSTSIEILSKLS